MTLCLGIESTAHTFGVAVVESDINKTNYDRAKCEILSNEKDSYSTEKGGMIPNELAEHHYKVAGAVVRAALEKANCKLSDIELVAFSQGPGIGNALRCGAITARQLAAKSGVPLIGVNHCVAHIEIGRKLCTALDPVMLYASGANTQIVCFENGYYRVFGETLDMGIGNFLDTFGRAMGMGFPAGPILDRMYFEGKNFVDLPYTVKGMDLAFSGLLTAAKSKISLIEKGEITKEDLVYSTLHNAFAMLTEVTERALAHTRKESVVLGGGVGCSRALQQMVGKMCEERGAKLFVPPNGVMIDNAGMIAWTGLLMNAYGVKTSNASSAILPRQRTDDVKVTWRK